MEVHTMLKYVNEHNLKEFLEEHNLSQAEFARRIGVAPSVITRIVKGEQGFDGMRHENAVRLAKEIGYKVEGVTSAGMIEAGAKEVVALMKYIIKHHDSELIREYRTDSGARWVSLYKAADEANVELNYAQAEVMNVIVRLWAIYGNDGKQTLWYGFGKMSENVAGAETRAKNAMMAIDDGDYNSLQDIVAAVVRNGGYVDYTELAENLYRLVMGDSLIIKNWSMEFAIGRLEK